EGALHVLAVGLHHLHDELLAARRAARAREPLACLLAGLEPGRARVAPPARIRAHVGRAAEAGDAPERRGGAVAREVHLQRGADEEVAGVVARGLAERAVAAQAAVGAGEEHVAPS